MILNDKNTKLKAGDNMFKIKLHVEMNSIDNLLKFYI